MRSDSTLRRLLLPTLDGLILMAAFLAAVYLRFDQSASRVLHYEAVFAKTVASALVVQLCLYYGGLYEDWPPRRPVESTLRLAQAFLVGLVLLLVLYYAAPTIRVGRGILALFLPLAFVGIASMRGLLRWFEEEDALAETVLILGTGATAQQVAREVAQRRPRVMRVRAFLANEPDDVGRKIGGVSVIGTMDELALIVPRQPIDRIIVALDDRRGTMPVQELFRCRLAGIRVEEAAGVLERLTGQIPTKNLRPSLLVFSSGFDESRLVRRLKNAGECVGAAVGLVVVAPLLLLVALAIRLTSRGPILYRQERVGEGGRTFSLLKFRTMRVDAEAATGPVWASGHGDPRINRLGRFLRLTRLDELPQLVNVIRGEMSFVGPRPERPHFVQALRQVIPFYDERHCVRPGITGWAQIKCGYGSSIEDAELKLQYDLYYIKHMSFAFDIGIILDTLKVVVIGRGAR